MSKYASKTANQQPDEAARQPLADFLKEVESMKGGCLT